MVKTLLDLYTRLPENGYFVLNTHIENGYCLFICRTGMSMNRSITLSQELYEEIHNLYRCNTFNISDILSMITDKRERKLKRV